jgi:hypothetical protein
MAAPASRPFTERAPCLLINPRSFNASRNTLAARAADLARGHGIEVLEAGTAADINAAIEVLLSRVPAPIFVLAGDGTVQALTDRLAALPPHVPQPPLFLLGGGRSNVTAAAQGGKGDVLSKLESALRRWRDGPALAVEPVHVLQIEQPPAPTRYGFLLAAGLLDAIIRACHRDQARNTGSLRAGDAGTAWTVLKLALPGLLLGREPPLDDLDLTIPGWELLRSPARLLVMTSLGKRRGMSNPFAERGHGPLRFSALCGHGIGLWARLPWAVLGRARLSGRCEALHVRGLSRYTLDGEEFSADPTRPVTIRPGRRIAFLTL